MDKTHQDFYDAARRKPCPCPCWLEFDGREPVNRVTRELVQGLASILSGSGGSGP